MGLGESGLRTRSGPGGIYFIAGRAMAMMGKTCAAWTVKVDTSGIRALFCGAGQWLSSVYMGNVGYVVLYYWLDLSPREMGCSAK
jgi:hypothetical protein